MHRGSIIHRKVRYVIHPWLLHRGFTIYPHVTRKKEQDTSRNNLQYSLQEKKGVKIESELRIKSASFIIIGNAMIKTFFY